MIQHIVMFKFKESANGKTKAENLREARERMLALKEQIPQIRSLEVHLAVEGSAPGNYDFLLVSQFETMEDLEQEFPREVTEAVRLLTHRPGTDYFEYVRAIRENPAAKLVKLADLAHNTDETRLAGCSIPPERLEHWRKKYAKAKAILME